MDAPKITTAIPKARWHLGDYNVVLLGDIESPDPARYRYILALVREGEAKPSFYVTSEKNPRSRAAEGSHRMRVISDALTDEIESSDRFADPDVFAEEGLKLAAEMLGISGESERLS